MLAINIDASGVCISQHPPYIKMAFVDTYASSQQLSGEGYRGKSSLRVQAKEKL